ncbi:MAG: DUF4906 domain-containing protein [Rikenellaceae bacterium]
MIKIVMAFFVAMTTMTSCQDADINYEGVSPPLSGGEAIVTFTCGVVDALQTRYLTESQESLIDDVNLYCYNENLKIIKQVYIDDFKSISLTLNTGVWKVYAIANIKQDLGYMSYEELLAYNYRIKNEVDLEQNNRLVMTYQEAVVVSGSMKLAIAFERVAAKVNISISLTSEALERMTLNSVRLINVPIKCDLFGGAVSRDAESFMSYASQSCYNGMHFSAYMLENLAGENDDIDSAKDKCEANAPKYATYIEIDGAFPYADVIYRVYLGDNATTDFNVKRNSEYDMNIAISGANADDLRVSISRYDAVVSSANCENGVIEGLGVYSLEQQAILTAVPDNKFSFSHWQVGNETFYENPLQITVYEDTEVSAIFEFTGLSAVSMVVTSPMQTKTIDRNGVDFVMKDNYDDDVTIVCGDISIVTGVDYREDTTMGSIELVEVGDKIYLNFILFVAWDIYVWEKYSSIPYRYWCDVTLIDATTNTTYVIALPTGSGSGTAGYTYAYAYELNSDLIKAAKLRIDALEVHLNPILCWDWTGLNEIGR